MIKVTQIMAEIAVFVVLRHFFVAREAIFPPNADCDIFFCLNAVRVCSWV